MTCGLAHWSAGIVLHICGWYWRSNKRSGGNSIPMKRFGSRAWRTSSCCSRPRRERISSSLIFEIVRNSGGRSADPSPMSGGSVLRWSTDSLPRLAECKAGERSEGPIVLLRIAVRGCPEAIIAGFDLSKLQQTLAEIGNARSCVANRYEECAHCSLRP